MVDKKVYESAVPETQGDGAVPESVQRILDQFSWHPPTSPEEREAHETMNRLCPGSPELQKAINHLMICKMWANAALAINVNRVSAESAGEVVE